MNREFGFNYWSNAIHSWEDFPDVRGTINGSLAGEYEKFQRELVTKFLAWQSDLVREYKRKDQFITHNFDFEWRGSSYVCSQMSITFMQRHVLMWRGAIFITRPREN